MEHTPSSSSSSNSTMCVLFLQCVQSQRCSPIESCCPYNSQMMVPSCLIDHKPLIARFSISSVCASLRMGCGLGDVLHWHPGAQKTPVVHSSPFYSLNQSAPSAMYRLQLPCAGSEMPTLTWRNQGANQMKTKENQGWMEADGRTHREAGHGSM